MSSRDPDPESRSVSLSTVHHSGLVELDNEHPQSHYSSNHKRRKHGKTSSSHGRHRKCSSRSRGHDRTHEHKRKHNNHSKHNKHKHRSKHND